MGQYDESLAAARLIGELANLLWLFCVDSKTLAHWQSMEPRERWRRYGPAAVRRTIQELKQPPLVKESDYRLLSEHAIHVTPITSPNTIGLNHQPSLGGHYREDAFLVCINEIASAVGVLCLPSVELLGPAKDAKVVLETARTLLESVGGARVARVTKLLEHARRRST